MTTNRIDLENWLPVEYGDEAVQRYAETSAAEQVCRPEPMAESTKYVPRFTGFTVGNVAKGAAYAYTDASEDKLFLEARKFGGIGKGANEDLNDLMSDPLQAMRTEAGSSLALNLDNSCFSVTAAKNSSTIKFDSVYKVLTTAPVGGSFDDVLGYTANANRLQITAANFMASGAGKGYDTLSDLLAKYEVGRFFDPDNTVVIAHHAFMGYMRKMKNAAGDPLLSQVGVNPLTNKPVYSVFGYTAKFSFGLRTSATDTSEPTGNPLLIIANKKALRLGKRGLQPDIPADTFGVAFQPSSFGDGFDSDEWKMKAASRRAFGLATAFAAAVIEING